MTKKQLFDSNLKYVIDVTNAKIMVGTFSQLDKGVNMTVMFLEEGKQQFGIMFYREEARQLHSKVDTTLKHIEKLSKQPHLLADHVSDGCEGVMNQEYPYLVFSSLDRAQIAFKSFIFADAMERFQLEAEATRDEYMKIVDKIGKLEKLNASL